jgi:AraC-like DNA-binding protein
VQAFPAGRTAPVLPRATELLSARQRLLVEADERLARLFAHLDAMGPRRAPKRPVAADLADTSVSTLRRLFLAFMECTYTRFVRRWRVAAGEDVYDGGARYTQKSVAVLVGLGNAARLRAAFLAVVGLLPTGRPSRARPRTMSRQLPLFRRAA